MSVLDFIKRITTHDGNTSHEAEASLVKIPVNKEFIHEAVLTLQRYKEGKSYLEKKIIENEQWYKLRHWECMRADKGTIQPASGWLFNSLANKHADGMDNIPTPNILPREESDKNEAEMLSSIIPVVLDTNDFEATYSDVINDKIKYGFGIYGVFWDKSKLNGLGDIEICEVDPLTLFWEPGKKDIQDSKYVFHVELVDTDILKASYPDADISRGRDIELSKYVYDDTVDTSNKTAVVDMYYKKNVNGKTVLHFCKFANGEVLFATENTEGFENGWYDHGEYPFVFDVLFPIKGTPAGFGYIDVGKDAQEYIDKGNQAILMNMLANTKPRHFIRNDGAVSEEEYADLSKDFIHVDGNLGKDSILPIEGKPLNPIYVNVINGKVDELKEVTGNRDVSTGGTTSGVTAASGIAAMQEASSKLSRDSSKTAYRNYKKVIRMVIELIRQFYDLPRQFRILGENGTQKFINYSNSGIKPQYQGSEMGIDLGYRMPYFDIEISIQKASPYSKLSQNELALQFYNAGFFNPQMADQALACLDMMDFDRKSFIMQKISQNGTMYQTIMQMQQQMMALGGLVDATRGSNEITQSLANQFGQISPGFKTADTDALKADGESDITKNARERTAEMTAPK